MPAKKVPMKNAPVKGKSGGKSKTCSNCGMKLRADGMCSSCGKPPAKCTC